MSFKGESLHFRVDRTISHCAVLPYKLLDEEAMCKPQKFSANSTNSPMLLRLFFPLTPRKSPWFRLSREVEPTALSSLSYYQGGPAIYKPTSLWLTCFRGRLLVYSALYSELWNSCHIQPSWSLLYVICMLSVSSELFSSGYKQVQGSPTLI